MTPRLRALWGRVHRWLFPLELCEECGLPIDPARRMPFPYDAICSLCMGAASPPAARRVPRG